ncbi:MAG: magnesium/cobalt transporter CorA [Deltaproteobacteria bacterium]|nr:magnesium/cobalt transporter CorA [Deltaproteobacteria bacterium]MBI2501019.1 magnesium/cobalt transporter CorA [Deltaproteobacteria bacterium]MBI4197176.1 magnesium/cobalt transporter CorA [Deltaproteobacteria bacterium]
MITIFSYSPVDGLTQVRDLASIRQLIQEKERVTWVDLEHPTPQETEILDTAFNFHPLTIDDCLSPRHQPKIDNYGSYLFLIVHEMKTESSEARFKTSELDIYLGSNYLLTFHRPKMKSLEIVQERLLKNPKALFRSADFLMATVLDEVVDQYTPVLDQMDQRVSALEDQIFSPKDGEDLLNEIFSLRRSLSQIKRISTKQIDLLTRMIKEGYDEIIPLSLPYLSNVRDHLIRASDLCDFFRDSISSLVDAHLLTSSNKTNETMKMLTIFASMMLPLTVITGVYGMNFKNMPELDWSFGYPFVIGLMAVVAGSMLFYFKKKKWL